MNLKSKLRWLFYAGAFLCFFLPFITVSCGGRNLVSLTGIQVATGTTVQQPSSRGASRSKKIAGEPTALVALSAILLALGLGFVRSGKASVAPAVTGGIGAISLLLFKSRMDDEILKNAGGMLQASYEPGFWLALLLAIAGAAANGLAVAEASQPKAPRDTEPESSGEIPI